MGPRPPRPGATALGPGAPVKVVRLPRRRVPAPPSAPLPEHVQAALASIAGDLRHLPRDCIGDAAELLHWLRRMAGRVEGVGRMRVVGATPPARLPTPALPRTASPRECAEAVFGKGPAIARLPVSRTIVSRRGQAVRVEVRRARVADQLEFSL